MGSRKDRGLAPFDTENLPAFHTKLVAGRFIDIPVGVVLTWRYPFTNDSGGENPHHIRARPVAGNWPVTAATAASFTEWHAK